MSFIRNINRPTVTDSELVKQYRESGDLNVLGELYQRYMELVYGVCLKYFKDPETAKDGVMQVFEELVVKLKKHEVDNFKGWLHQVAKNHCLMQLRTPKNLKTVEFKGDFVQSEENVHLNGVFENEENLAKLEYCLGKLTREQQQAIRLFYLDGKCYNEIVEITGMEWNQVRSFIQNGRRNLKLCMESRAGKLKWENRIIFNFVLKLPDNNNHIEFSATMIDRYHKGELSAKERHDLEKAAMDDPFLADALEGYAVPGVNTAADIKELKSRLSKRTRDDKVIPIATGSSRSFPWLRAAAVIIFLVAGGLIVYQLGFNRKQSRESIAKVEEQNKEIPAATDSVNETVISTEPAIGKLVTKDLKNKTPGTRTNTTEQQTYVTTDNGSTTAFKTDTVSVGLDTKERPSVVTAPVKTLEQKDDGVVVQNVAAETLRKSRDLPKNRSVESRVKDTDQDGVKDKFENAAGSSEVTRKIQPSNSFNEQRQRNNYFNGRVTDLNNNPLPFANVLNTSDSVGTYADARGYFNLSSTDTVLNVQVRSLGYNESNLQLRNGAANNQIYLKEDLSISPQVLDQTKRNYSRRAFEPKITVEESEPADGWAKYDTYIANNLQVPTDARDKEGEVEISFEVTKKGVPIHIKVEKSLCAKCDEEAIRLVKQGPKWKRKGKKGRGSVTIPFSTIHQ